MRYYGVQNEVKAYCNRLQNETSITVTPSLVKTLNDRVESLKKSGAWSRFGLGFNDNDGDSYLQRASVTNILGRSEVLWFVRGMKSLGLWQNMVCWPLRSYQNAGTGSTVFSLGGFGIYNATSFNSPSWGNQGITFGNSSYLLTGSFPNSNYLFNSTVFKFDTIDGTSQGIFGFTNSNRFSIIPAETTNLGRLFRTTNNSSAIDDYRFSFSLTTNTNYLYSTYVNGINKVVRLNKGAATATKSFTTDIFNQTSSTIFIGAANNVGVSSLKGSIAFTCLVNLTNNQSLKQLFEYETLYSQTLGSNLSLP
jgi:hypothetical protein